MMRIVPQDFDSEFLGGAVYRVEYDQLSDLAELATQIPEDACLVSLRIQENGFESVTALGFRQMETLVEFVRPLTEADAAPMPSGYRYGNSSDSNACAAIAGASFTTDRYHKDPLVSDEIADRLKEEWARNNTSGRADCTIVAEKDGEVVGFVGCLLEDQVATVDLIAVDPAQQGTGIGRTLLLAVFAHYARRAAEMRIATQTDNINAVELYKKLGFREVGRNATYHLTRPERCDIGS